MTINFESFSQIAGPFAIGLLVVSLISALIGLGAFMAGAMSRDVKTQYCKKIFAGLSYLTLGLDGILATPYIFDNRLITYVLGCGFAIMGFLLMRSGFRLRRNSRAA